MTACVFFWGCVWLLSMETKARLRSLLQGRVALKERKVSESSLYYGMSNQLAPQFTGLLYLVRCLSLKTHSSQPLYINVCSRKLPTCHKGTLQRGFWKINSLQAWLNYHPDRNNLIIFSRNSLNSHLWDDKAGARQKEKRQQRVRLPVSHFKTYHGWRL